MTTVLAWLCDSEWNIIDDEPIKVLSVKKDNIDKDGYFESKNKKYLFYGIVMKKENFIFVQ